MSFKVGDQVLYKYVGKKNERKPMYVEFIDEERITCSYLETNNDPSSSVRTVVLNKNSLETP